jgi:hypothetical protein
MTVPHPVLRAALEVTHDGDADVLVLSTGPEAASVHAGAQLVRQAVAQARASHTRHVITRLEASTPGTGVLLAEVRAAVSPDVERVVLRRAGSTVVVDLELLP